MIVIKIGGSAGIDLGAVCDDVARMTRAGTPLLIVHGGSHATDELSRALGHPPRYLTSPSGYTSRYTDRRTLETLITACAGTVNKTLVEQLARRGVRAVGLSGLDGRIWEGRRKSALRALENGRVRIVRDSLTGVIERVNAEFLRALLAGGYLPVLSPPAITVAGEAVNVDADRAAAATAIALNAQELLLLSNVPGLLRDPDDETSVIRSVALEELESVEPAARGRMRIKLLAAHTALEGGLRRVVIADARGPRPVCAALEGAGTEILAACAAR